MIACQSLSAVTINADQARIKTAGGLQNGVWNIWSNGEWGDFIQFKGQGPYRLEIEARGSPAIGIWSHMNVLIDGEAVGSLEVETRELKVFSFPLSSEAGIHRLTVQFTNDFINKTEDRNLYVKRMTVIPADGQGEAGLGDEAAWRVSALKRQSEQEREALAEADRAIERIRKEDAVISIRDTAGQAVTGASVKVTLVNPEFLFGCNIFGFDRFGNQPDNDAYKTRFAALFNFATTAFYWRDYEREPGKPNYAYTDKVLAWCKEQGIRVKGHPLLWGNPAGIASWIQGLPTPDEQRQRVSAIISHYRGQIEFWEVVNEASHFSELKIDQPYRWAHEADPNAHLNLNDYNVMADGCPEFYAILQQAIASGVPFDGVGIQAHEPENVRFPLVSVRRILSQYAGLGKDLYITEFTPVSSGHPVEGVIPSGVWDEQTQADYAVAFYTICFANPSVKGITWWDLCDRMSWRKNGGLLRDDLSPKPVYLALEDLIHRKWTTREQGKTDASGTFSF
ncbi:MAG TPA: endo-1,4-beta-xylanase, partial [Candidatus Methylacidiphilales bacterium]